MDNQEILRRFDQVKTHRTTVQENWDKIERFVCPYRGRMFKDHSNEHSVEWNKPYHYDSTAVNAAQMLASSLHSNLTSSSIKWFDLTFRNEELNADVDAREWLEEAGSQVFTALQDSNFELEANEVYLDLTCYGTAGIMQEVKESGINEFERLEFTAVPLKEVFFEPGERGVHIFYRLMKWEATRIVDKFGKDNCPQCVLDKYDTGDMDKFEVVFCIYPRPGKTHDDIMQPLAPQQRPWGYKYVLRPTGELCGEEGGYYDMPAYIPRWRKTSESMWGHSPAMYALGDIVTANSVVKMLLEASELAIDPPVKVQDRAVLSDLDLRARSKIVVRDMNALEPFITGQRVDVGELRLDDLRASIRQYFYVDQLQLKDSPAMTATEVQVRYELMQRYMAATIARLQADFLDPVVERTFRILARTNQLPPVPQVVVDYGEDSQFDVNYLGPLVRAQRADQVAAVERWLALLAGGAQFLPELLDTADPDEISKLSARMLSVPATMLRNAGEVAQIRKDREQAMARAQEAETAKVEGEAMVAHNQAQNLQAV